MKHLLTRCAAFGAGLAWTSLVLAAEPNIFAPQTTQVRGTMAAYFEDAASKKEDAKKEAAAEPAPAAAPAAAPAPAAEEKAAPAEEKKADNGCADAAEPNCGDKTGCSDACGSKGCFGENWGDLGIENCWPFNCCCKPGDPWKLQSCLGSPCCEGTTYGGWLSMGYYTNNDPLSVRDNDLLSFWDNPNALNFDQEWFYVEKLAKSDCGWGYGYRFDLVYGVDAQKTQAFGNSGFPNPQGYDNSWDNGKYGWALPQSYLELANGDLSVKIGHFYTLVGYEVVPKTGNFFYSHSFAQFNSEPFMHTGVLGTYKVSDSLSVMAGWVLGWDTGYDQFGDGNAIHAGFTKQLNDNVKYSYMMTGGDLGWRGDGYSHSNVIDFTLSKKWEYVLESDLLTTSTNTPALNDALSYGIGNYVFYTINDCWKWGVRAEWWKSNQVTNETTSYYEVTTGFNYKANANLLIRPEVKFNWTPSDQAYTNATGGDFNQTLFGIDAIYTF